jgi:hypothetical protein
MDHGQPEVRLLRVRPGSVIDPLECDLYCMHNLDSRLFPTFGEASSLSVAFVVNGHKVYITPNLYAALEHLRDLFNTTVLWVDAVCVYPDRHRTKCCRNLRFEPLLCEGDWFCASSVPNWKSLLWCLENQRYGSIQRSRLCSAARTPTCSWLCHRMTDVFTRNKVEPAALPRT